MRIVFWQNCLSPHQLPYIVHLLEDERVDSVVVAAGEAINETRENMGWDITSFPGLDKCEVYLAPTPQTLDFLLSTRTSDSHHFFSGIRGFIFVFNAFQRSLKYKLKRGLITERPNTFAFGQAEGKPLWLHRIRFLLQDKKYVPYIQTVFAMGDDAVKYFNSLWEKWTVFPFAYCTQNSERTIDIPSTPANDAQFLFIGCLSYRKATIDILKSDNLIVNKVKIGGGKITIIGEGPERSQLEQYIHLHKLKNVNILGTRKNSEIPRLLMEQDVLILPSIYDGWGAVVNEALTKGLYVICSDKCGAKELLSDKRCGSVFCSRDYKQLATIMQYCIEHIEEIRNDRAFRLKWAQECISGKVIARYMIDCLMEEKPQRPWIKQ